MSVKIKSSIKTIEVEWPNGRKDVFAFDAGRRESLIEWYGKAKELQSFGENIKDENTFEELYRVEHELLSLILGERVWRKIWKKSNHGVFQVFQIVAEVSRLVKDALDEATKTIKANG